MAVKTYKFDDNTQLSPHFNVQEFRCKCSQHHDILIAEELVDKLERLYAKLDCSKIIITSGMRCPSYDISIGGNGGGQHPLGKAADVVCYNQNGDRISSKLVCCTAQDLGFGGIANIDTSYTATHLDVRTSNIWYGNEVINYHTVTDDFYKYYGIARSSTTQKTAEKSTALKGIDVSVHKCELCGTETSQHYEIHHINKVKNLRGKELWEQIMIAKRRKTLVVCRECHKRIHGKKAD